MIAPLLLARVLSIFVMVNARAVISLQNSAQPLGYTLNGTYTGASLPQYSQEAFLGIPFASAPRLTLPESLNTTWNGTKAATGFGLTCSGFGTNTRGNWPVGEDCLNMNIVRPEKTYPGLDLPVMVWIYGGGWRQGSNRDLEFNLSYIVETSVEIGHPVIAVSINYRLSAFGFLNSEQAIREGVANLGIRDQWKALEWINENIHGFGGDKNRVTIWGESAGGVSVGLLAMAYDGDNHGLFRSGIAASGTLFTPFIGTLSAQQTLCTNLTVATGCHYSSDSLQCLRDLDFETLNSTLYSMNEGQGWAPIVDGDLIKNSPIYQFENKRISPIPLIVGCNSDEGIASMQTSYNTSEQLASYLMTKFAINATMAEEILELYPLDAPSPPYSQPMSLDWQELTLAVGVVSGNQTRRAYGIGGDWSAMSGRRRTAQSWAQGTGGMPVYSYRFDTDPSQLPLVYTAGLGVGFAQHGSELSYEFRLPYNSTTPYPPLPKVSAMQNVSYAMQAAWVSFAATGSPNHHGLSWVPEWPVYTDTSENFVFNGTLSNVLNLHIETDDFREEGIQWFIDRWGFLQTQG